VLSEEDAIRSAKYTPRELPRVFEEERFLFPETYRVNRVRLLVKDPDWLFAYWDVDPGSIQKLVKGFGKRAVELSRLTLRITDPHNGGHADILLPAGARWWYVRADVVRRAYRAEIGITLPSGEFRRLAQSNVVTTPRVGPSSQRAGRRVRYQDAVRLAADGSSLLSLPDAQAEATGGGPLGALPQDTPASGVSSGRLPGASDSFRPGGASDTFRR
jgi:hypothetical protein